MTFIKMDAASLLVVRTLQTKCNMNNTKQKPNMKTQNYLNVTGLVNVLAQALQGHMGVLEFEMRLLI